MRRLMRTERFLRARRAEDITEEALVLLGNERTFMALVSDRMWRMLEPQPETHVNAHRRSNMCAIGAELFVAGGTIESTGQRSSDVLGYDAVSDDWFRIPMTGRREQMFAANVGGRLVIGSGLDELGRYSGNFEAWDADSQRWQTLPTLPEFPGMLNPEAAFDCSVVLIATVVGNKLFLLSRTRPSLWNVYDFDAGSWSVVLIPLSVQFVLSKDGLPATQTQTSSWPDVSVLGDRILVKAPGRVYHYDVTTGMWASIPCDLPRHIAFGKRSLVVAYVGHRDDANNGYATQWDNTGGAVVGLSLEINAEQWTRAYEPDIGGRPLFLPVCYARIERVFMLMMP